MTERHLTLLAKGTTEDGLTDFEPVLHATFRSDGTALDQLRRILQGRYKWVTEPGFAWVRAEDYLFSPAMDPSKIRMPEETLDFVRHTAEQLGISPVDLLDCEGIRDGFASLSGESDTWLLDQISLNLTHMDVDDFEFEVRKNWQSAQ